MRLLLRVSLAVCAVIALAVAANTSSSSFGGICFLSFVSPRYSPLARKSNIQGEVTATLHVDRSGHIVDTRLKGGHVLLQSEVTSALEQFQFCQQPREIEIVLTFDFRLEGEVREGWSPTTFRFNSPASFAISTAPPSANPGVM